MLLVVRSEDFIVCNKTKTLIGGNGESWWQKPFSNDFILAVQYNVFFFSKFLVQETGHKFCLSSCLLCLLVSPPNIWYIFLFSQDPHISPWPVFFETQWIWEQLETLTNVADFWTHRLIGDGSSICLFYTKAIHIFCAIFSLEPLQTYQQSACLSGCKVEAWAPPLAL